MCAVVTVFIWDATNAATLVTFVVEDCVQVERRAVSAHGFSLVHIHEIGNGLASIRPQ